MTSYDILSYVISSSWALSRRNKPEKIERVDICNPVIPRFYFINKSNILYLLDPNDVLSIFKHLTEQIHVVSMDT